MADSANSFTLPENKQQRNKILPVVEQILKIAFENYPAVQMGDTAGTLYAAKKEMDKRNLINGDNYYHRLGMCLNGQKGSPSAAYSFAGGLLKEGIDIAKKTWKGQPMAEIFSDSGKDLQNNWEGIQYGLKNPNKSCRMWLNDLDINTNTWKNR